MFVFYTPCKAQNKIDPPKDTIKTKSKNVITSYGPTTSVRPLSKIERATFGLLQTRVLFGTMENRLPISQAT